MREVSFLNLGECQIKVLILAAVFISSLTLNVRVDAQTCLPNITNISNSYPQFAGPNEEITITTVMGSYCPNWDYQVTVDIMPTGYIRLISSAVGPVAVNRVTTPNSIGPWSLDIIVKLIETTYYGTINYTKNTIVIQITPSSTPTQPGVPSLSKIAGNWRA